MKTKQLESKHFFPLSSRLISFSFLAAVVHLIPVDAAELSVQLVALHSDALHVSAAAALDKLEEIAFVHIARQLLAVVYNMQAEAASALVA